MSKIQQKLFVFVVLGGIGLTLLTFFIIQNDQEVYCAPTSRGILQEMYVDHQKARGLPFSYYKDAVPGNCQVNIELNADADVSSKFEVINFGLDVLFWTGILEGLLLISPIRKKK